MVTKIKNRKKAGAGLKMNKQKMRRSDECASRRTGNQSLPAVCS